MRKDFFGEEIPQADAELLAEFETIEVTHQADLSQDEEGPTTIDVKKSRRIPSVSFWDDCLK